MSIRVQNNSLYSLSDLGGKKVWQVTFWHYYSYYSVACDSYNDDEWACMLNATNEEPTHIHNEIKSVRTSLYEEYNRVYGGV